MSINDVTVVIDIERPAPIEGLGTPLILHKSVNQAFPYREFGSLEEVAKDYSDSSEVYKKASFVFNQGSTAPNKLAIASYGSEEEEEEQQQLAFNARSIRTISDALDAFYYKGWHFLHLVNATTHETKIAGDYIANKDFKFLAVEATEFTELANHKGQNRTILFYHPVENEAASAALIGSVGSLTVGSVTYKFKKLQGLTPQDFDANDLNQIHDAGALAYVTKAGDPQTSEGKTASGEYIDVLHGKDWIKANMETRIQRVLSTSSKVPYTNDGISLIEVTATDVLNLATENGIIAKDTDGIAMYTVNALGRDEVNDNDRADRIYKGLSFNFDLAGAIHEVSVRGLIRI
ncbi:DUF3383 family protein [Shouchella lehensis]|uniref:DUF3383 family protein n=1 Tax=Shouchella lehensis TaxID=300825 RepID=A0A4Y7WDG8_9BACI|nr:DUF3383 family protein [Shouchella lehensis]MBG9783586.1 hypothetical protein [Shouchella lehensis]TES45657.1 DUF3383 family protein [Shouchella lehensis]